MRGLDIAIAGCGPCGLAAALLLHRAAHHVTLFERFDTPRPNGSGLMLQPMGMAVLSQLGLLDTALARGARIDRLFGKTGTLPLMLTLERLSPLERAAFLLHDVFGESFDDIAQSIGGDPTACLQLAARARKHVRGERTRFPVERDRGMARTAAFFEASKTGDAASLGTRLPTMSASIPTVAANAPPQAAYIRNKPLKQAIFLHTLRPCWS